MDENEKKVEAKQLQYLLIGFLYRMPYCCDDYDDVFHLVQELLRDFDVVPKKSESKPYV